MIAVYCPRHGADVLMSERRIRCLRNAATAVELDVECYCGERITVRTGRLRTGPRTRSDW